LNLQPHNPDALYRLAYWSYQVGDREQAGQAASRLVEIEPTHLAGWILLGQIEEKSNHPLKAIQAYLRALALKEDLIDIRYTVGVLYQEQGKSQEAERQFKEVIRLNPKDAGAHLNLGVIYANMNRLDEAEQAYKNAISLNPKLVDAHYNLGVFYEFHRNDTQKALAHYQEYVDQGGADDRITNLLKKAR
jgi:tetratricopeptide (TPR) repeat protein